MERYYLNIPGVSRGRRGIDHNRRSSRRVGFESVYVARASEDTAESINAHLRQGLHVVLSPGIYNLSAPLKLNHPGQVLLGLGLATLIASGGPAVCVGDVDGVRVAGLLLEPGPLPLDVLLEWGGDGHYAGDVANPGFLHDVFMRVGGPAVTYEPHVHAMLKINSGHVVGDNLWLWRADHTERGLVYNGAHHCDVGLLVEGDDVTMYGLSAEHSLQDQVRWNGDRGSTYFFQSELPYDVDVDWGTRGYVGYRVGEHVSEHRAYGIGVYHYFRDHPVVVETAIVAPPRLLASIRSPLVVRLNGKGKVRNILNDYGSETFQHNPVSPVQWLCDDFPPEGGRPYVPRWKSPVPSGPSCACKLGASTAKIWARSHKSEGQSLEPIFSWLLFGMGFAALYVAFGDQCKRHASYFWANSVLGKAGDPELGWEGYARCLNPAEAAQSSSEEAAPVQMQQEAEAATYYDFESRVEAEVEARPSFDQATEAQQALQVEEDDALVDISDAEPATSAPTPRPKRKVRGRLFGRL